MLPSITEAMEKEKRTEFDKVALRMLELQKLNPELTIEFLKEAIADYGRESLFLNKVLLTAEDLIEHNYKAHEFQAAKAARKADPKNQPWEKRLEMQRAAKAKRDQTKKEAWAATLEQRAAKRQAKEAQAVVIEAARKAWKDAIAQRKENIDKWNAYVQFKLEEFRQAKAKAGIR